MYLIPKFKAENTPSRQSVYHGSLLRFLGMALVLSMLFSACGQNQESGESGNSGNGDDGDKLTQWEQDHGIGPVKEPVDLGDINPELASNGAKIFKSKCSSCHKMDEDYVGPAMRDVTERREPEYVMNMILNPDEMVKKHPEAYKMLAEYMTPMPQQNVNREQARAILEYFRQANREGSAAK